MPQDTQRRRFRFHLGTLLVVVAIVASLMVVVIQQVQLSRQQMQIQQMRQEIDRFLISQEKLTEIIRELRDQLDRHR